MTMNVPICLRALRDWPPVNNVVTGLTRAIFRLLRRPSPDIAVKHLPRCGNVKARLPNGSLLRLWSRGDDWVSNHVYWRGWTADEPEALPLFYHLATQAAVVLDIGAHVGIYSLIASYANPSARVFAFEPFEVARNRMIANVRRNDRSNIEIVPSAVANKSGPASFYCPPSHLPCSSSLSLEFMEQSSLGSLRQMQVDVVRIDDFCAKRGVDRVDLAKLDIEGVEPDAMEGMRNIIKKCRPDLFVEILYNRGADTALDTLARELGYNVFALDSTGPQYQQRICVDPCRRNYLFTARSRSEVSALASAAATTRPRHLNIQISHA